MATKTQYQEILSNLENGVCNYENERTGVWFALYPKMKRCENGEWIYFNTLEKMARCINKFVKTGY